MRTVEASPSAFHPFGEYCIVEFSRRRTVLKDTKGLRYLARLLAEPGREFHVIDLMYSDARWVDGGDAGPLLDELAKQAYRRRITEIDDEIDDARILNDDARVLRATNEREALSRELARAVGMGGRDRRAGAASERTRVAVTRAIRNALKRIGEQHPELAEHLDRTIRTGTYCAYLPDPRSGIVWKVGRREVNERRRR